MLQDGDLTLFESGAIVLHLGEGREALLPAEPGPKARAVQWLVAALNSIEPHVMAYATLDVFYPGEEWAALRRDGARAFALDRLTCLARALGDKPYLDGGRFTAGDLMMASVLRIDEDLLEHENLRAYLALCIERPAFGRALEAQLADFRQAS